MDYKEAKGILGQILTDTVIATVKAYVERVDNNPECEDNVDAKDTSVITAWYDPEEYNSFEFVQKYRVPGSPIFNHFIPCVTIKSCTVNDLSINVPCGDADFLHLFFSKKDSCEICDDETIIYDEDVFKSKECKEFLLRFMEDTFPKEKHKVEELFAHFQ